MTIGLDELVGILEVIAVILAAFVVSFFNMLIIGIVTLLF
jgi:hypothetical protein